MHNRAFPTRPSSFLTPFAWALLAVAAASITPACGSDDPGDETANGSAGSGGSAGGSSSGGSGGDYVPPPAPDSGVVHTYEPTFTAVWNEVLLPRCIDAYCHTGGAAMDLSTQELAYQELYDVPADANLCKDSGLKRVVPGDPDQSLLITKLDEAPPCGARMPARLGPPVILPQEEIDQMREWITLGAPND